MMIMHKTIRLGINNLKSPRFSTFYQKLKEEIIDFRKEWNDNEFGMRPMENDKEDEIK